MKKRLFLDMDGTLARFHDVDKTFIEAMWQPGFYVGLKPFENMVEGVKIFMNNHPEVDVYILSAVLDTEPPFVIEEKNKWLDKYLPEVEWKNRLFTGAGENKAEALGGVGPDDYLLDDYNKNLHEFEAVGAHSIKFRNDVNHKGIGAYGGEVGPLWDGQMISYDLTPEEIASDLSKIFGIEQTRHETLNNKIAKAQNVQADINFRIKDVALLSDEEYLYNKNLIPIIDECWWLRSSSEPGEADCVVEFGVPSSCRVDDEDMAVRPALRIEGLRNFIAGCGNKVSLLGNKWTVLESDGKEALVLCDKAVERRRFDKDSSVFSTSELKTWLDKWLLQEVNKDKSVIQEKAVTCFRAENR